MDSFQKALGTINGVAYKFDLSVILALFGGSYAIAALDSVYLYAGRRWLGWYNYPGMIDVGRKYGQLADSWVWKIIFPRGDGEVATIFGLAGKPGPKYAAFFSGTKIEGTGHLGYLLKQQTLSEKSGNPKLKNREGGDARTSKPGTVTIVQLGTIQGSSGQPVAKKSIHYALLGLIPMFVSTAAGILCLLAEDYLCAALIFSAMLIGGISSFFIGSAELLFHFPEASELEPRGDGLMDYSGNDLILLKGAAAEVNAITRGAFSLTFSRQHGERRHALGIMSLLLIAEVLAQLLLIPLATFFGQVVYLASLLPSGVYHIYMAEHARNIIQEELLVRKVQLKMEKVTLGTRAQMAVFVCMASQDGNATQLEYDEVLKLIIPNDAPVWKRWRESVVAKLQHWSPEREWTSFHPLETEQADKYKFSKEEEAHYNTLMEDAWSVSDSYRREFREKSRLFNKDVVKSTV